MDDGSMLSVMARAWSARFNDFFYGGHLTDVIVYDKKENGAIVYGGRPEDTKPWVNRQCAIAALKAIRMPTDVMRAAIQYHNATLPYGVADAGGSFTAAIDAALSEQP